MWKEDHHFYAAAMHFPSWLRNKGKKGERIEVIFSLVGVFSPLTSLSGCLFTLWGRGNSSSVFSTYKCKAGALSNQNVSAFYSVSGSTAAVVKSEGGDSDGGGLVVWRQRVQSVNQLTSLYLSQWVQSCLLVLIGTLWPPQAPVSPHHPTRNCHVNSFSDRVPILLDSTQTLFTAPISFRKKNPRSLGRYSGVPLLSTLSSKV